MNSFNDELKKELSLKNILSLMAFFILAGLSFMGLVLLIAFFF